MDIYLSVNNREEVLQIPVLPSSFTISKPQSLNTFETVSKGELQLIGEPKLKGITISSFFPIRDYPYLRCTPLNAFDYVYTIDTWIAKKLPIRLIITDTPINMAVAVKNFEYTIKTDGDLWYTLELEEFNLLGYDNPIPWEDEIDMEELNKLKEQVAYLEQIINEYIHPYKYDYVDENMPDWARAGVSKAMAVGAVNGKNPLDLDYKDLRHLTIMYRAGCFKDIYNYNDINMPEWAKEYVQKAIDKGYLTGTDVDEDGSAMYNLSTQDLRLITIMGRAGILD